jgi:RNA polymerase sigma factor (sigma-70 family)
MPLSKNYRPPCPRVVASLDQPARLDDRTRTLADKLTTRSPEPDPLTSLIERDLRARLRGLIPTLPDKQREVLELFLFGDLSLAESSRRLGISRAAVSQRWVSAISALRRRLGVRA